MQYLGVRDDLLQTSKIVDKNDYILVLKIDLHAVFSPSVEFS